VDRLPGAWAVGWPTLHGGQYDYIPLVRHLVTGKNVRAAQDAKYSKQH